MRVTEPCNKIVKNNGSWNDIIDQMSQRLNRFIFCKIDVASPSTRYFHYCIDIQLIIGFSSQNPTWDDIFESICFVLNYFLSTRVKTLIYYIFLFCLFIQNLIKECWHRLIIATQVYQLEFRHSIGVVHQR